MPRICYHVAMSLDGCIAGPKGETDWLIPDPEMDFNALFARFDTFLMGRRTFELTLRPGSPPLPPGTRTFVVSRTLQAENFPGVTILPQVSPSTIGQVRAAATRDIWLFGGGELFRGLLDQGLVDRVEVAVMPVVLGGGLRLLPSPARQTPLRLTGTRAYTPGIVALEYDTRSS